MKNFLKGLFGKKTKPIDDTVSGYIGAIESWLDSNANPVKSNLNGPATEIELSAIESELCLTIPISIKQAYLLHNGEKPDSDGIFGLWRWLPLNEVKREFHLLKDHKDSESIRIPVLLSPGGDILYAESGEESEIIDWWHEKPTRDVKHSDFKGYLKWFTSRLYQGEYVYLPDEMSGLVDKSEL
jgi:hypothetical protein